jgi:hypothetical protein
MRARAQLQRIALVMAVLAAVAVRFVTPAGWMPNPNGIDGSAFVICTGDGPLLAHGLDIPGHSPKHGIPHERCLFSGISLVGGPDPTFVPTPPLRVVAGAQTPFLRHAVWRPREKHRLQSARAPPLEV